MIPLPCNPTAITIGSSGLRNGRQVTPVTSIFSHEDLLSEVPNALTFEKYPELQRRIFELLSSGLGRTRRLSASRRCYAACPACRFRRGSPTTMCRLTVVEFLDAHNFCLAAVKRSCVHFVTPKGQIIPFDTYNLLYRNGEIDAILGRLLQVVSVFSLTRGLPLSRLTLRSSAARRSLAA